MQELKNDLITSKYTKIVENEKFELAPCDFKVIENSSNEVLCSIHFQEGPVKENDINGIFNEDAIAMVIRRLECFQNTQFKCRENAIAITKLEEALMWLRKRTIGREKKGVIGTHKV